MITYHRSSLFAEPDNVAHLRRAVRTVQHEMPFAFEAAIILPDHLHFLWTLPAGDKDFSKRVGRIKVEFTHALRGIHALPADVPRSRQRHRESNVWQRRFWEHTIRDEDDFELHLNYIHYNPVKHGLAACPHAWPYSSFRKWVARGVYGSDWACACAGRTRPEPDWSRLSGRIREPDATGE